MSIAAIRPIQQAIEREHVVSAAGVTRVHGHGPTAVTALRGVSLQIAPGEVAAVLGAEGSWKSTLMHILGGLDRPTSGDVRVAGVETNGLRQTQLRRLRHRHIGFVYQFFNLVPAMTAEENILEPLGDAEPDPGWIAELLDLIDLRDDRSTPASQLSRGQQQKVAIARALVSRPTVLLADDPTGAVGDVARDEIVSLLRQAASRYGQTIVISTDDRRVAAIADRCITLEDGIIVADTRAV
jgi:putative ABC transport system ATP-binding protein